MKLHQKREARPGPRRLTAVTGAATLATAALVVGAPAASAAEQTISGASFTWGLSDYIQYTGTGAPGSCHYLSAGSLDGTSAGATQSSYSAEAGNVAVQVGDNVPTFSTKCSGFGVLTGGQTATGSPGNQRVIWSGGTGTRDSATGAATISFPGTLSVKFSGAPFRIVDPVLTVDSAGNGVLKATISAGANPDATVDTPDVTIAELTGLSTSSTSEFTSTPTFAGRTITVAAASQPTQAAKDAYDAIGANLWGAWPEPFVLAANTGSVNAGGRFYSSSPTTTGDGFKKPLPITVNYGTVTTEPQADGQTITVSVPEAPEECAGELVWTIQDGADGDVALTPEAPAADHLPFSGAIDPITIADGRTGDGAACYPAFGISGQVSDFTGPDASIIPGANLGWTPNVTGTGLAAGAPVASGFGGGGPGLSAPAPLAATTGGSTGSGDAAADLELKAPLDADAGDYEGTLTLTGLT